MTPKEKAYQLITEVFNTPYDLPSAGLNIYEIKTMLDCWIEELIHVIQTDPRRVQMTQYWLDVKLEVKQFKF